MQFKWIVALFSSVIILSTWIFFHPSYQKSLEARFYYAMGDYDRAYLLAQESFSLDRYNRMASTVMAQSQMTLKYIRYNENAKKYKKDIYAIAAQKSISSQERAKITMMTQIMIDGYQKLGASVMIDSALMHESKDHYVQFKKLHDELSLSR